MSDTADDGPSMVMAGSGCVICRTEDDDTHRYWLGRLDNGPAAVLQVCPAHLDSPRIRRTAGAAIAPSDAGMDAARGSHVMMNIDLDGPVMITPHLAAAIASVLHADYPGCTAMTIQIALNTARKNGRGLIGLFAADQLFTAMQAGTVVADAEGVLMRAQSPP